MKRIKQIEESKNIIANAFVLLLQDYKFHDITISMITKKALIGRNTFYSHFKSKEEVFNYIMNTHFQKASDSLNITEDFNLESFLLFRFNLLKNNSLFINLYEEDDLKYLFNHFRNNKLTLINLKISDEYKIEFIQGGITYITKKWISNGMKESPEEIVSKIMGYL